MIHSLLTSSLTNFGGYHLGGMSPGCHPRTGRGLTFLAVVSVVMQCVAAMTVTAVAADCVLTLVLASSVINSAFVAVCTQPEQYVFILCRDIE